MVKKINIMDNVQLLIRDGRLTNFKMLVSQSMSAVLRGVEVLSKLVAFLDFLLSRGSVAT